MSKEKRFTTAFLFYYNVKYSDILWGSVIFVVTFCKMLLYLLFSHAPLLVVINKILESKMPCLFYSIKKYLIKEI